MCNIYNFKKQNISDGITSRGPKIFENLNLIKMQRTLFLLKVLCTNVVGDRLKCKCMAKRHDSK